MFEDDDFLDDPDLNESLGIITPEIRDISELAAHDRGPVAGARSFQPPVPGYIDIRLAQVARARGVVNPKGPYAGQVSLSGLVRGTSLAATTIQPLLHHPGNRDLLHFDTLSRLCEFLRCQPGDLLVYRKGPRPKRG